ncbi:two component, sigma54 specific, transcriptional regulator, Fis family [Oleidesulfovibrio alaskensis G20]|jgi:DNA-binding NtrC family response regulator|uniref:Two component, sigma54 specific, transcriptional regulator, Fis family n=1 Tax=Oleidesulfovibrio alaskensis (strain ATCC BAA-1058 / DSM 17464 / G20) TaxID=207559 RepID=Q314G6_OLEA2|nr:sigma-54 dependent transcriptional regulator [Oleidesulfovibrio alaskensis]ABB37680.1 two component, sigma54 specific, transcriptional regulator, Fis family [Oleidesulfovibrio alaskensis G20]
MSEIATPAAMVHSGRLCLLIVDDERDFASGLARLISSRFRDIDVVPVFSAKEALEVLAERSVHLMMTDLRMPEMGGMQLLRQALEVQPGLSMVVLTAHGTIETAVEALQSGAYDFLTKPIEPDQLFSAVAKGLERSRLLEENNRLRQIISAGGEPGELVGEGRAMQQLKRTIAAVAQSDYTVLVRGESGTGKELVARLVHRLGNRAGRPFMAVNCPAIPENLLESELFGHVKGAFTGADRDHKGLFAVADKGTLHLDEIGDISAPIQTKLLRCLQDGEIRPVGASRSETVDVRVVASTNQDLEARIADKSFREDLYYRLNVLTVTLPPLRERVEDIPLLVHYLLRKACTEMGLEEKEISPDVVEWMTRRTWPGNVRELQNFVRRLTVFCAGRLVDMDIIRMVEQGSGGAMPPVVAGGLSPGGFRSGEGFVPYKDAKAKVVDDFTTAYLRDLLTSAGGNVSEAARMSGLSRVALQKILTRLDINVARYR